MIKFVVQVQNLPDDVNQRTGLQVHNEILMDKIQTLSSFKKTLLNIPFIVIVFTPTIKLVILN